MLFFKDVFQSCYVICFYYTSYISVGGSDKHGTSVFPHFHNFKQKGMFLPYPEITGAREVLAILVQGQGHDAVRRVEGLLHTIAVVDVYVNVQHPLVVSMATGCTLS